MVHPAILPAVRLHARLHALPLVHRLVRPLVHHSPALAGITAGTAPIIIKTPVPPAGIIAGTAVALLAGVAMASVMTAAIPIIITTTVKMFRPDKAIDGRSTKMPPEKIMTDPI